MNGFVSIVGAGPGDPELLTLRALRCLRQADLVLTDALVPAKIVELASRAKRFFVGKRSGRPSIAQETIHKLMIRAARRGERVVRLKCGDPFVFGRGGEEAIALHQAGVPFEIVLGVSSAIAAPALAGIPVTHRGLASGFAVLSGHTPLAYQAILDGIAPGALTLVFMMGLSERAAIAKFLLAKNWPSTTPAAIILGASHPDAATWIGTIAALATVAIDTELPGVIVIGAVVSLSETIQAALPTLSHRTAARHSRNQIVKPLCTRPRCRSHGACRPAPSAKPSGSPPLLTARLRADGAFGALKILSGVRKSSRAATNFGSSRSVGNP